MRSLSPLVMFCCPRSLRSTVLYHLSSNRPSTVSETMSCPSVVSKCVHWKEVDPSALLWVLNNILSQSVWDLRVSTFKHILSFFCCLEESALFAVKLQIFYGLWSFPSACRQKNDWLNFPFWVNWTYSDELWKPHSARTAVLEMQCLASQLGPCQCLSIVMLSPFFLGSNASNSR